MASDPVIQKTKVPSVRFAIPQHVASRAFPTEMILLNLNTGQYHGLNPTGGRMYEVLGECGHLDEAAARLSGEFGQPLEAVASDLRDLCAGLVERGLLETAPA